MVPFLCSLSLHYDGGVFNLLFSVMLQGAQEYLKGECRHSGALEGPSVPLGPVYAQEHPSHRLSRSPICWTLVQHCCALARGGETNPWCTGHGPNPQQTSKPQEIATFRPGNTPYLGWGSESLALVQSPSKHTKVLPAQGGYRVWDVRPDLTPLHLWGFR